MPVAVVVVVAGDCCCDSCQARRHFTNKLARGLQLVVAGCYWLLLIAVGCCSLFDFSCLLLADRCLSFAVCCLLMLFVVVCGRVLLLVF